MQTGISIPCGNDEAIYVYHFGETGRIRLIEAFGNSPHGNYVVETRFSSGDGSGSRMFYASWGGVQCASVWNVLDYRLFRIDPSAGGASLILSNRHSFVLEGDVHVSLEPSQLLIELPAGAIFPGFRRTYVLKFREGPEGMRRIDPVALRPEDFVHEWLIEPWSEMRSRSAEGVRRWHARLHAGHVFGNYEYVQPCKDRPGFVQILVASDSMGERREIPNPLRLYFLVQDKGDHRYVMAGVSLTRQAGCPGETRATDDNPPSLFKND